MPNRKSNNKNNVKQKLACDERNENNLVIITISGYIIYFYINIISYFISTTLHF